MKRKCYGVLCFLLSIMLCSVTVLAHETKNVNQVETLSEEEIDEVLRNAGMPEDKIAAMDSEVKEFIVNNAEEDMEYVNVTKDVQIVPYSNGYTIGEDELQITVTVFKYGNQLSIYPTYEWLVPTEPKGKDYFGYSVSDSYSVIAGERSNIIYSKIQEHDEWINSGSATYTGSSLYGYEHSGESLGTPDFPVYIKGAFAFKVDIDSTNPVKKMTIAYVHDTSFGSSFSYGIGYGPASISITPSSSNVGYQNNVYNLEY